MHGSTFSVPSLKTSRKNATKQVTQANATSGFLLDMSDLIENGSTVSHNSLSSRTYAAIQLIFGQSFHEI